MATPPCPKRQTPRDHTSRAGARPSLDFRILHAMFFQFRPCVRRDPTYGRLIRVGEAAASSDCGDAWSKLHSSVWGIRRSSRSGSCQGRPDLTEFLRPARGNCPSIAPSKFETVSRVVSTERCGEDQFGKSFWGVFVRAPRLALRTCVCSAYVEQIVYLDARPPSYPPTMLPADSWRTSPGHGPTAWLLVLRVAIMRARRCHTSRREIPRILRSPRPSARLHCDATSTGLKLHRRPTKAWASRLVGPRAVSKQRCRRACGRGWGGRSGNLDGRPRSGVSPNQE